MSRGARLSRGFRALVARLRGVGSPARLGVSIGVGLFIGCLPLYGLHLALCLLVCLPLRLDAIAAYLAANVSNPVFAPFLLFAEVELGSYLLTGGPVEFDLDAARRVGIGGFVAQAAVGGVVLGAVLGVAGGLAAARIARKGPISALDAAIARTIARYQAAPAADRYYVASKLRVDPVLERVADLGALGRVLDAGSGRGQLGLCLLELGRVERLRGFDFDARKVEVARRAARGDAEFGEGELATHPIAEADTVLFVDVLHYLPREEQDALLARAVSALAPGGRLVVREVDARRRFGGVLTRALERVAAAIGYNRSRARLCFRSLDELARALEALGAECRLDAAQAAPLSNALLVAIKRA